MSAGTALKELVLLVGGSSSGFSGVIAAYVTTFTVTIAVSVICLGLAFAMYAMRTDQMLRRDQRYGGRASSAHHGRVSGCWDKMVGGEGLGDKQAVCLELHQSV